MEKACGSYDIIREGDEVTLRIDCETCTFFPSLEDSPRTFSMLIDILAEAGTVTKVIFTQKRDYEYDYGQTILLIELAKLYKRLIQQRYGGELIANPSWRRFTDSRYAELQDIIHRLLKSDPLAAYVELKRVSRREALAAEHGAVPMEGSAAVQKYISIIDDLARQLEATRLITLAQPYFPGFKIGDRSAYRKLFAPSIKPDFMFTKLMSVFPADAEELDSYSLGETEVTVFSLPESVQYLYHVVPPEFKLTEEKYELLDAARKILAEHKPKRTEFVEPERMRQVFQNVGSDLLDELASYRGMRLREKEREELAKILVRYTVGFGLIEVLLEDDKVQDISINSPMGRIPMFIVHGDWGDCMTNIIPTVAEAESWASKLRLISGRPLDEANPILDTELVLPTSRARVATISAPLNPTGLAYSFRRHRDKPWTLPLFVHNKMVTPLAAGVLSFLIDGARTMLVAGTRSAGKTSLLASLLVEIMRRIRTITIEDSVTGDSEIVVRKNQRCERTTIGQLVDSQIANYGIWNAFTGHEVAGNKEQTEVLAMTKEGKIEFARISKMIRHKVTKPIFKVVTRTGRALQVTGDHSLFGLSDEGDICEVKAGELQQGRRIAVPNKLPLLNEERQIYDLSESVFASDNNWLRGSDISRLLKEHRDEIISIASQQRVQKRNIKYWFKKQQLPSQVAREMAKLGSRINNAEFRCGCSKHWMPFQLPLATDFLAFAGLWLADGSYDLNSTIISVVDEGERDVVRKVAESFGLKVKMHSDGISLMLHSKTFKRVMQELGLVGTAYTKRIPSWVFGLAPEQIGALLKGVFSGDGCVAEKEIMLAMASRGLLQDIQTLLLLFGITFRIGKQRPDKTYACSISAVDSCKRFKEHISILQQYKKRKLDSLCSKKATHSSTDTVPLSLGIKGLMIQIPGFNAHDYVVRNNDVGRNQLTKLLLAAPESALKQKLELLAKSDILWDEVREVSIVSTTENYVYDLSVPECESFVANNIVAHNTLELPVSSLKDLGYNIQSMKVASALTRGSTEVTADEGIRTTLRLGDSALVVGEVRSVEARALYEAMRVGALANVVMGTIHGDSPYGVFDRVVNDLGVPRTSFKATDIVVVANPIRSPDGIHRWRRITNITEVRKQWEDDPVREGGFVDLFKYDAKTDALQPTNDLLNGDSEILKSIAGNVKEWAGNWDAVWDNIQLRTNVKQAIVDVARKSGNLDLLEAQFVIRANDEFHKVSEQIREEVGALDSKRIFFNWNEWLRRASKVN